MQVIEQSHAVLVVRFGDAIRPAVFCVTALVIGLVLALFGSATDQFWPVLLSVLVIFAGLMRLVREKHVTLTIDRVEGLLTVRQWRYMMPSGATYSLREVLTIDALSGTTPVSATPPGAKGRFDLVIDFRELPDYAVRRGLKRDEAADAVRLLRGYLHTGSG